MRIQILQDKLRVGGTERQSLYLARVFREAGHEAELLVFEPGGHLATEENLSGLAVSWLQKRASGLPLWAPGLLKQLKSRSPDVVLCMGRTANSYAGFVQRALRRSAVVGTLRTGKAVFPLHHWSMGQVRAVLVNSNWWKRRLLERNFPAERIHVVHNALLLERAEGERLALRRRMRSEYGIGENCCILLNVATFRPGKRHRDLLQIVGRLRREQPELDWRLWLVGDGAEYRRCKRWAARNGLGTRIRFFHFQKDPFPYYAAADLAVSASREDSLPNFLIEAQASRLPLVAYDCRGVKETCRKGKTGHVPAPGDEEGFVRALAELIGNREKRERWAERAPAFARKRFARHPQALSTLQFLERLGTEGG